MFFFPHHISIMASQQCTQLAITISDSLGVQSLPRRLAIKQPLPGVKCVCWHPHLLGASSSLGTSPTRNKSDRSNDGGRSINIHNHKTMTKLMQLCTDFSSDTACILFKCTPKHKYSGFLRRFCFARQLGYKTRVMLSLGSLGWRIWLQNYKQWALEQVADGLVQPGTQKTLNTNYWQMTCDVWRFYRCRQSGCSYIYMMPWKIIFSVLRMTLL